MAILAAPLPQSKLACEVVPFPGMSAVSSRARAACILVASPRLLEPDRRTPDPTLASVTPVKKHWFRADEPDFSCGGSA